MMIKIFICFILLIISVEQHASELYDFDFINDDFGNIYANNNWLNNGIDVGVHSVSVSILGKKDRTMKVEFLNVDNDIKPCFTAHQLAILGIKKPESNESCFQVKDIDEDASYEYISSKSTIVLSVPEMSFLKIEKKLRTQKELWDHGINSAKVNYNFYSSIDIDGNSDSYLSLNANLSLGDWRINGNGSLYKSESYFNKSIGNFYAYTDIDVITSELSIGQITTSLGSSVNSGLSIIGMKLGLSEQMLNPNWNSYAPVIKDRVNSTSAKVSIFDEDRVVYSKLMTTGEFSISEFDISSVGSDLKLVIEESDGTTRIRRIPYTRLPNMLKENSYSYNFSFGQYHGYASELEPAIFSGQVQYGFETFTSGINTLLTTDYQYIEFDNTFDFNERGAFSLGLGMSSWNNKKGNIVQLSYAKFLKDTNTSLQFAGTQYRSSEFRTFTESLMEKTQINRFQLKNTIDISINQGLYDYMIYLGYKKDTYHNKDESSRNSFYSSVNMSLGKLDFGFSFSLDDYNNKSDPNIQYGLNMSFPLGENRDVRVSDYISGSNNGDLTNNLVLTKSDNKVDYSLSLSSNLNNSSVINSGSVGVRKQTSFGDIGLRTDWSEYNSKISITANGGILTYNNGIIFTPQLGTSSAIVDFGIGAENIILDSDSRNITNKNGVGVIPYTLPYTNNKVLIDTTDSFNVEINSMPEGYIPRKGSTIFIPVDTSVGIRKLFRILSEDDLFGEPVFNLTTSKRVAYVGVDNIVYFSGLKTKGKESFTVGTDNKCLMEIEMEVIGNLLNEVIDVKCSRK